MGFVLLPLTLLLAGCTTFYRSDYFQPTLPGPEYERVDCGDSQGFGPSNGVAIAGPGKTLYICSKSQSGRWFTMGFLLPIFPVTGRNTWSDDLRWIKFGLKPDNSRGWNHTDSLEVAILGVEYADSAVFHAGPYGRMFQSRPVDKRSGLPLRFRIFSQEDGWLGFPGQGDVLIEFQAEGFPRRKVRFSPASAYGITFLTV